MAKWLKPTALKTYNGVDFAANVYTEIPSAKEEKIVNNTTLWDDIGLGTVTVAKDDSGNTDITGTKASTDYLTDNLPTEVNLSNNPTLGGIQEPNSYRARMQGMDFKVVPKNTTDNVITYPIEQLTWQTVDKKSYFDGVQYYAENAKVGDYVKFQVIDKGDPGQGSFGVIAGWYTQAEFDAMGNEYIVEEFGDKWYVAPNKLEDIRLFKSALQPGLFIRVVYHSTGTIDDVPFFCNLYRFMKTDEDA